MNLISPTVFEVVPESFQVPEGLDPPEGMHGEVIVLLADVGETASTGWADQAVVTVAQEWAEQGLRVLLADGDLASPSLHALLAVDHGEGLADFLLYGASPARVAHPVPDRRFLFTPAGTIVPHLTEAFEHQRWPVFFSACRQAGTVLLLYLPANQAGIDALIAGADRVMRFCDRPPEHDSDPEVVVFLAVSPQGSEPLAAPSEEGPPLAVVESSQESQAASEVPEGETVPETGTSMPIEGTSEIDAPSEGDAQIDPGSKVEDRDVSPDPVAGPEKASSAGKARWVSKRTIPWLLLILALLMGGVLIAVWLGYFTAPSFSPSSESVQLNVATGWVPGPYGNG